VAAFLTRLGYPTARREELAVTVLGLPAETANAIGRMELLAEDDEQLLRVILVQLRSLTAKARNELARDLGRRNGDHVLILTKDYDVLEFVLIAKETRQRHAPGGGPSVRVIPKSFIVMRKASTHLDRRILRRMTWTGTDGLDQFEKLRSVFEAAHYSATYFQNRALFADHYLETRLREDDAWRADPSPTFAAIRDLLRGARDRWAGKDEQTVRAELYEPLWKLLGLKAKKTKPAHDDQPTPDYQLHGANGEPLTVVFCYRWDRWLDGPDLNDPDTPEENPGAAVVSALAENKARWVIVTNGKCWRLYSRDAHSRSTNFYEVDLEEALLASGDTDPNEAFRYWWLFFRREAFETGGTGVPAGEVDTGKMPVPQQTCWLDTIVQGSRDYAKRLGERLKDRVFGPTSRARPEPGIFAKLAEGFLRDRRKRLGNGRRPTDEELKDTFEATLTLLYRLLFLLYAESRDLLPIREAPYYAVSLKKIKEEIAERAGVAETDVENKLKSYSDAETSLYDRLSCLFRVMDQGAASLNVPRYNGGLFVATDKSLVESHGEREQRIARFLLEHKIPDRHLALAIDRLARDVDEKTVALAFIDYKSLEVRHLGSVYEGLLEFKLKIAEEDLTTKTEKKAERYIPLSQVRPGRGRRGDATPVVRKGEVYLSNDKAERKATGSYYTPDPIVEYIVEHTVGPVLSEKLEALRPELHAAGRTYHRHLTNAKNNPHLVPKGADPREVAAGETYKSHRALVDRVFDLKVLDPAMGSGHFLVEAVDFITDRLLDFLNRFPHNPVQFALDKTRRSILDALGEQGVTVDPDKLTDVNLLKRHVLKRCIYGVDLNPMAVELAKVSLWLDAFTLGAPLSFLDHHLRCGNSLIGATFEDLKKATADQLFAINYEPLLRAIRDVLFVNEMADATAAEVHQSADAYARARKELSGYQIVLDLLVADHFVSPEPRASARAADPNRDRKGASKESSKRRRRPTTSPAGSFKPSDLLRQASDLDLTTREALLASLTPADRPVIDQVDSLARRPDLRFFHWEIEFPEVFFDFADADRRRITHRNEITPGSAGFDAVVGNPPYDELSEHAAGKELPEKHYFKDTPLYRDAHGGRLNVFRLFVLRAMSVLRERGRHSFIVPMALLADQFTAALRKRLLTEGWLRSVTAFPQKDDPHNRVFFEAKLSTCIYVSEKHPDFTREISVTTYPGKSLNDAPKRCTVSSSDLARLDPTGLSLPAISDADLRHWKAIESFPRTAHWTEVARCYLGELMTNASNAHLTSDQPVGPRLLRGANINHYVLLDEPKQGKPLYLREAQFLKEQADDIRSTHHSAFRIGFQESCPIDNWRRLIACVIPAGHYCVHKIRYFAPGAKYDLYALLATFNSKMPDWRFCLTSTNNSVNAYEVDALPIPRFERLNAGNVTKIEVDWERWERVLSGAGGVAAWEGEVMAEMKQAETSADAWADAIHDALAVAGKEMTRLAQERQRLTREFADWLVELLGIDEERFSGMTYLRGGQANFDTRDWAWFHGLVVRNRRACGTDPERAQAAIHKRYEAVVPKLTKMRERFRDLDAAIDRIVWQLVGLAPDGSLPT
jgi:type I restriction-modification system DNA methylase subunit